MKKKVRPIYTYLMKSVDLYKIGQSNNPERRLHDMTTGNPHIELLCYGRNYYEKQLHSMFKKFRVKGEWFSLPEDAVQWIENNLTDKHIVKDGSLRSLDLGDVDSDVTDYIIDFGRHKGRKLIDMKSEEDLNYCRYIFFKLKQERYNPDLFKKWYFFITGKTEEDLNYKTFIYKKHNIKVN